jgi:hypothetical protein
MAYGLMQRGVSSVAKLERGLIVETAIDKEPRTGGDNWY